MRGGPLPRELSPFPACASASVPLCVSGECFAENKEVRSKGGRRGSKSPAIKSEWKGEKGHKSPLPLPPVAVYAIPPLFRSVFRRRARRTLQYRSHQLQLFFLGGGSTLTNELSFSSFLAILQKVSFFVGQHATKRQIFILLGSLFQRKANCILLYRGLKYLSSKFLTLTTRGGEGSRWRVFSKKVRGGGGGGGEGGGGGGGAWCCWLREPKRRRREPSSPSFQLLFPSTISLLFFSCFNSRF